MTTDEAFEQIEILTQAETEPKLAIVELKLLVSRAKRVDDRRRLPSDVNWTPTFNIGAAVALGWEMKAAKVATAVDFKSADQSLTRSQLYAQLMKVSNEWRKRAGESVRLKGDLRRGVVLPAVNSDDWWPYAGEGWTNSWWDWANNFPTTNP